MSMRDFLQSLTHAVRVLRRNPAFTLSALAVLMLGIGANTAIFSVVNAVLLKPLPFPGSDSIVTIFHVPPVAAFPGMKRFSVSVGNYLDWQKQNDVFESMSMFAGLRTIGSLAKRLISSPSGTFKVLSSSRAASGPDPRGFAA